MAAVAVGNAFRDFIRRGARASGARHATAQPARIDTDPREDDREELTAALLQLSRATRKFS